MVRRKNRPLMEEFEVRKSRFMVVLVFLYAELFLISRVQLHLFHKTDYWDVALLFIHLVPYFALLFHAKNRKIFGAILQGMDILITITALLAGAFIIPDGSALAAQLGVQIYPNAAWLVVSVLLFVFHIVDRPGRESFVWLIIFSAVFWTAFAVLGGFTQAPFNCSGYSDEINIYASLILIPACYTGVLVSFLALAVGLSRNRWFRTYSVSRKVKRGVRWLQIGAGVSAAAAILFQCLCAGLLGTQTALYFEKVQSAGYQYSPPAGTSWYSNTMYIIWEEPLSMDPHLAGIAILEIVLSYIFFAAAVFCVIMAMTLLYRSARNQIRTARMDNSRKDPDWPVTAAVR